MSAAGIVATTSGQHSDWQQDASASGGYSAPQEARAAALDSQTQAAAEIPGADGVIVVAAQEVEVSDVVAAARRLAASVEAAGGRVTSENTSLGQPCPQAFDDMGAAVYSCGGEPSSVLTYRVAAGSVDSVMNGAAGLGQELWRTRSATDVSDQIADTDARVASARASLDRLNALMAQAESLTDIIAVEAQIATRQAELESLLARQQQLADQTAEATITTTFAVPGAQDAPTGLLGGLQAGLEALGTALVAGLTVLGWLLPFMLVVLVIAVPVWLRRRTRRTAAVQAPTAQEQDSGALIG